MNKQKTLLQRVQSRISKRRDMICELEDKIADHYCTKEIYGVGRFCKWELQEAKENLKEGAASQKLDKELFAMLLEQERNKYAGHFRSKYRHWMNDCLEKSPLPEWVPKGLYERT